MSVTARALACAWLACAALPALAADGVVEINQACAAAGCFAGDAAGLPVEIDGSAGASYRLSSDLVVPGTSTSAIVLVGTQRGVRLDLGGFTIRGPVICPGAPPASCSLSGSAVGIDASAATLSGVAVRNGVVTGLAGVGVALGDGCALEGLVARENAGGGVRGGTGCRVRAVTASRNGGVGLELGERASLEQVIAYGNVEQGIVALAGSEVHGSTARSNGAEGIDLGGSGPSLVAHAVASTNGTAGIACGEGCVVRASVAFDNGGAGIMAGAGSAVHASTSRANGTQGLSFTGATSDAIYTMSTFSQNGVAAVSGGSAGAGNHCTGAGVATPPDCP